MAALISGLFNVHVNVPESMQVGSLIFSKFWISFDSYLGPTPVLSCLIAEQLFFDRVQMLSLLTNRKDEL
ncbi:MAG TPA: hypothetical protein DCL77_02585 [Prolixibacteraceae bacterium]|nr:hypothetical protein [Prolixibacteraceae bacterium]